MAVTEIGGEERRPAEVGASVADAARGLAFSWDVAAAVVAAMFALVSVAALIFIGGDWIWLFVGLLAVSLAALAAAFFVIGRRRGLFGDRRPVPAASRPGSAPVRASPAVYREPAPAVPPGPPRPEVYEMAARPAPLPSETLRGPAVSATAISADLAEQGQMIAERLAAEQTKVTEALEIYGQSIETRLNLASVALAREFRDCGDVLNRRVESAGEAAIGAIARQVDSISVALGRSAEDIERRLLERSRDLLAHMESVSASTAETVAILSDTASGRVIKAFHDIAERTDATLRTQAEESEAHRRKLLAALEDGGRSLSERAEMASGLLESKLLAAAASLDRMVENAVQRIETRIAARIEALGEKLVGVDRDLDAQWTLRSHGLAEELTAAAQEVGIAAQTAAETAKQAFAQSVTSSTQSWLETAEQATRRVETAAGQAAEVVAQSERSLNERLGALGASVTQNIETTAQKLVSHGDALNTALAGVEGTLQQRGGALIQAIDAQAGRLDEGLAARLVEIGERLSTHRSAFDETLSGHVGALDRRVSDSTDALRALADRHAAAISGSLDQHHEAVAAGLAGALSTLQERVKAQDGETAVNLQAVAQGLAERWLGELKAVAETLQTEGGALHGQIVARQSELIEAIQHGVAKTETSLSESLQKAADVIDTLAARIDVGLEQRGQAVARTLAQATQTLFETMTEGSRDTVAAIERGAADAAGTMDTSRNKLLETVSGASETVAAALDAGLRSHSQGLETRIAETMQFLMSAQRQLEDAMDRVGAGAVEHLQQSATQAQSALEVERERLVAAVSSAARDAAEALAQHGSESRQSLTEETDKATERLEQGRAALIAAFAQGAESVASEFTAHTGELQRVLGIGADKLRRELAGPLGETLKRIEAEGVELAGATRTLAETLARTSTEQRDQLHQVFAREADALTATVTANAETFRRDFESVVGTADTVFLARGVDLARTLGARIAELKALLEGDGFDLLKGLESRSENLASQIDAASQRSLADFERKASGLINLLTRRGDDLLSAMTASASESSRKVGQALAEVDAGTERATATLREIERKVGGMLTAIDRREAELALGGLKPPPDGAN